MSINTLPDSYDDREQAFVKHTLLKSYLQKLFLIVGASARGGSIEICYVDCFAGPWGDDSESMETTSIAISLQMLEDCRQALARLGTQAKMRALFIEKDRRAFKRLDTYLANFTPTAIEAQCRQGDFVELRDDILQWAGNGAFAFFFIDPKGWKAVGIEILRPLLERPRSEFLINFMYNNVNRTMSISAHEKEMTALVGEHVDLSGKDAEDREHLILSTYRTNLKRCVPMPNAKFPPRTAYVRVLHPVNDRTWYHLVYVTSHPKGIIEFLSISDTVDVVQKQVRATKKEDKREERTKTLDLFRDDQVVDVKAGRASEADVDKFWIDYLEASPQRIDQSRFADILEKTDWFPSDLQASLVRLVKAGTIRNLDADGNRPKKPLHIEGAGERLELVR